MARIGGSATFSGINYQALYTATRFAEAITEESIITLCPEAHHTALTIVADDQGPVFIPEKPVVDDLLIIHQSQPAEYISLKYRDSRGSWDAKQLRDRGILTDFLKQHQKLPDARLLLVTQSPIQSALKDCVDRAKTTTLDLLEHDLGTEPLAVFIVLEAYLQAASSSPFSRAAVLQLLQQIELETAPAHQLDRILLLTLRPHTANAEAAKNILIQLAHQAAEAQLELTPDDIRQELIVQKQPFILPLATAEVMDQLRAASFELTNKSAYIGRLPAHHIERPEINELVAWVQTPLPPLEQNQLESSIKSRIIIGGAGVGKTVLLRDVCRAIQDLHIPVLGLRADRIKGATKGALLHEIQQAGLLHPLQQALATVATAGRPAVVIIDQLDALSMCLSGDRSALTSYTSLIDELCKLPHIRLILSCRTFDLQHDPDLAVIRQAPQIEVPLLSLAQVTTALQAVGATADSTSRPAALQELLRVPLHLALYCELDAEARHGAPITSVQGLYERLLDHYLVRSNLLPPGMAASRVEQYLADMVRAMYRDQTLTLLAFPYKNADKEVFAYLISRGVLLQTGLAGQQLVLFHQSFYEYLFARQFVLSGQLLADFVLQSGQGLFQRSLIQQVLSYLRSVHVEAYYTAICQLLSTSQCRTHIELLLAQYMAFQAAPYPQEQAIAAEYILPNTLLLTAFLEVTSSRPWLDWLVEPTIFRCLMPSPIALADSNIERLLFWRLSRYAPDLALVQVNALPADEHKAEWIIQVLDAVQEYTHPLFVELFEQTYSLTVPGPQQFVFWNILHKAAPALPQWVAAKAYDQLACWPDPHRASAQVESHMQSEVFKALYKSAPALCLSLSSRLLRTWIKQANYHREPLFHERKTKYQLLPPPCFLSSFDRKDLERVGPNNAPEAAYYYAHKILVASATLAASPYQRVVAKWLHSRTKTLVHLALAAVAVNPANFTDAVVRLFTRPGWLAAAAYRGTIGYYSLTIFPAIWDAASPDQRTQLAATLSSRFSLIDEDIHGEPGSRRVCNRFGRGVFRFLLALTPARLTDFPELRRLYQSLLSRWGEIPNNPPGSLVNITHGPPSPASNWKIAAIPPHNWLKALRKYRANTHDFWHNGGTYDGLCHQLSSLIKQNPVTWQPTLQLLLDERDESLVTLLPNFSEAAPDLAEPLIDQAVQANILPDDVVRRMRYQRVDTDGSRVKARLADVRADLTHILHYLDTEPTVSDKSELLMRAINSPGGNTIYNLLKEKLPAEALPEVLETLYTIAGSGSIFIRAAALHHVALLLNNQVPTQEVVAIALALIGTDYDLLEPGLNSLQYLIWRDKPAFFRLFESALTTEKARKPITQLLTVQWGHNEVGAYELLEQLWAIDPDLQATSLRQLDGYDNWSNPQVLFEAFELFLKSPVTKKLRQAYDSLFRDLPLGDFDRVAPLFTPYLAACAAEFEHDHSLIDYLAKNAAIHPVECVAALDTLFCYIPTTRGYWPAQQALEVLLEAYTHLPAATAGNSASEAALDLFDKLLARSDCRSELDKTLNQLQASR